MADSSIMNPLHPPVQLSLLDIENEIEDHQVQYKKVLLDLEHKKREIDHQATLNKLNRLRDQVAKGQQPSSSHQSHTALSAILPKREQKPDPDLLLVSTLLTMNNT